MSSNFFMEQAQGFNNEYIIKDNIGITLGRLFILELDRERKTIITRLRFYKDLEFETLKLIIEHISGKLIKSNNLYKINIIVDETLDTKAFVDLGFSIEGIIKGASVFGVTAKNEYILGVSSQRFNSRGIVNGSVLRGVRIQLKVLTPEYSKELLDYYIRNKIYLCAYEPTRDASFYTLEEQRSILEENYTQYLNGDSVNMGIFKDDVLIGKIQLSNIVQGIFKNGVLGYSLDQSQQGHGYMKEAVDLMTTYAFDTLNLHRVEASTLKDNIKSQKVLDRCGFQKLGINEKYLYIHGAWQDHITFYKVKEI